MFNRLVRIIKPGDRRKHRRVKTRMNATVGNLRGRITDLSLGGCGFYAQDHGLEKGDRVLTVLMPDDEPPIEVPSRIVGVDKEGLVFCVSFSAVGDEQFDRIQALILEKAAG